jgi:hypothetical protein
VAHYGRLTHGDNVILLRGFLRIWQQKVTKAKDWPAEHAQLMRAENRLQYPDDLADGMLIKMAA